MHMAAEFHLSGQPQASVGGAVGTVTNPGGRAEPATSPWTCHPGRVTREGPRPQRKAWAEGLQGPLRLNTPSSPCRAGCRWAPRPQGGARICCPSPLWARTGGVRGPTLLAGGCRASFRCKAEQALGWGLEAAAHLCSLPGLGCPPRPARWHRG